MTFEQVINFCHSVSCLLPSVKPVNNWLNWEAPKGSIKIFLDSERSNLQIKRWTFLKWKDLREKHAGGAGRPVQLSAVSCILQGSLIPALLPSDSLETEGYSSQLGWYWQQSYTGSLKLSIKFVIKIRKYYLFFCQKPKRWLCY